MAEPTGPLAGIVVLDLTRILAGPFCTQILGDLGAEVIKIERPGSGDDTRRFGPPFLKDASGKETKESAYFMGANRNKRSVTIDIAKPEGQALVRRIADRADVLVENFKLGDLKRYRLSFEDLNKVNKGLVYCSITGFGQTGPYAARPGYDPLIQAMGGIMSVTGEPDGEPMKAGVPIADIMAGMYATVAICAALRHREVSGKGQYIDIGMLDTQVAWLSIQAMNYLIGGANPQRLGNGHPNIVPYQVFATADGHIMLTIGNDQQFQRFCEFAGCPALASDARFATNAQRVGNRNALIEAMKPVLASKPSAHWLENLERLKIGCGPINNIADHLQWLEARLCDQSTELHIVEVDGQPGGDIRFDGLGPETEISVRLAPEFRGGGIAAQAIQMLLTKKREERLFARIVKGNIASMKTFEKCGFRVTADCGEWWRLER